MLKLTYFAAFPFHVWANAKLSHVEAASIECLFQETKGPVKPSQTTWRTNTHAGNPPPLLSLQCHRKLSKSIATFDTINYSIFDMPRWKRKNQRHTLLSPWLGGFQCGQLMLCLKVNMWQCHHQLTGEPHEQLVCLYLGIFRHLSWSSTHTRVLM